MEFDPDQRLPLASMHLAKLILDGGEFLDHLTLSMRSYNLTYPPEVQASLDDRLLKIQTDLRDINKVIHKDIQLAMQQRLRAQQPGIEDEDKLMESASEPGSPPCSPPSSPPGSPLGSPPGSPPCRGRGGRGRRTNDSRRSCTTG